MRADDETSAEMDALRTQRLWHAYTGSDRHGPRSPLRAGLVVSVVVGVLVAAGAFVGGVIAAARDESASTTTTVPPATTVAPATTPPPTTVVATPPPTTAPASTVVEVSSTTPWTDSGIDLTAGQAVDVDATGVAAHDVWDYASRVGPAGDARPELGAYNLVTDGVRLDGRHLALIGRVNDGPPFVIGPSTHLVAPVGGRLYLGVNDNGLDNNEGAFTVVIAGASSP